MKKIIKPLIIVLAFFAMALLSFKYAEELVSLKKELYTYISKSKAKEKYKDFDQTYAAFTPFTHKDDTWYQNTNLVYHAGCGLDGLTYSNSKEAMEAAVQNGNVIEVDFLHTKDGILVCCHDWARIADSDEGLTLREFQETKIYGKYTPMTAEDLVQFMTEHKEIFVVVDTKEVDLTSVVQDLINLAKEPDILNRFIIQLYKPETKQTLLNLYPFPEENFLFTCYKYGSDYKGVLSICMQENISVVTLPYNQWDADVVGMFKEKNIVLFEHTVNRVDRVLKSKEKGITKFYTDFLTEDDLS